MRTVLMLVGSALVVCGAALVYSLLYDPTDLTQLLGLDPEGAEAIVVLVGLGFAASASVAGFRLVRRSYPPQAGADAS